MTKHIVILTNLFPNSREPTRGIFTFQLACRLANESEVSVLAPIPWHPKNLFNKTAKFQPPYTEPFGSFTVEHPRHIVIPKIGRCWYAALMILGIHKTLKKMHTEKSIDVINVHWAYPDGVAAVWLGKRLGIPVVLHVLGCDLNEFAQYQGRRQQVRWALNNADGVIFVSQALAEEAKKIGMSHARYSVILNGVDTQQFFPQYSNHMYKSLHINAETPTAIYVGNFNVEKGVSYLLQAWQKVQAYSPESRLCLVGSGPLEMQLRKEVEELKIQSSVIFVGRVPHQDVAQWVRSATVLCLPSLREGCPNIVLESLAVGTPVVASEVGAVPQLIQHYEWGKYVPARQPKLLADALLEFLNAPRSVYDFKWMSWEENADLVNDFLQKFVRN